ncbi:MAG: molybdopterin oxidoreductase family protein [Phreatobacter sp.]|uniref:molybdopterin oxidoreductase family protein n=1 Tax=Phreatobacter sp. TaxID=1966341 RepID=UPI001A63D8CE|nr:molybdopterin oxidoreductase family protein [Phreatobacter sp.]MBL8571822.1 molybdopterin oxidoreductase family protein [Phreatobacter sp.]
MPPFEGEMPIELSPMVADDVKTTTCYMCACRCGIKVHLKNGRVRYIEGNKSHPVNKGVLCGKGSAGIMQQYSPAKLTAPLLRVGERGSGEFKEISWDEALALATGWLGEIRGRDPRKLAFFTGRDQSQSLTGWWAAQFGTPNFAAHGGFCSVNMAAAGLYSIGGSFWEFGEPDWDHARYLLMFGVAEDHDSNPIKTGIAKLKARGAKFVSVNPVRTGYSAVADEWIGIRPGTDGLLVMALIHEVLKADRLDLDFLGRYTNATWLVVRQPGGNEGLFARDAAGQPMCWDGRRNAAVSALGTGISPKLVGEVELPEWGRCVPVFQLIAERYLDARYAAEAVATECGVDAATIKRLAAELVHAAFEQKVTIDRPWTDWTGKRHERMEGRPVSFHAMRGISAHSNGFQTCRAIHVLQMLLGAIDRPGSWRYKAPYPKPMPGGPKPAGKTVAPNTPLGGMPLGFPLGPEDLLVDAEGKATRIDKAYSWEAPVSAHGLMHLVIANAHAGDPYPIDLLFMYMANMSWNSAMNSAGTIAMLTDKRADGEYKIPKIIYSDAFYSEMVAYADLILPDTTYLERWDCISILDRPIGSPEGPGDAIRQPILTPDRDVRPFQDVIIELGARLKLPGFTREDGGAKFPGGYPDYIANHERRPGIGPLAGWRGADGGSPGKGAPNPGQLARYVENGCFWRHHLPEEALYFKYANRTYLEEAVKLGLLDKAEPIVLQLYVEPLQRFRLAARGHGTIHPPENLRDRLERHLDPLPIWYRPFEEAAVDTAAFPMHAVTQRPMPMYHAWHSQNAWLRQVLGENRLYVNRGRATTLGIADDDWVWIVSHHGRVKAQVRLMEGCNADTVWTWNAIGKRSGAWNLAADAREATNGFLLNHAISEFLPGPARTPNADPVTGQAAWYDLRIRLEKCAPHEAGEPSPRFDTLPRPPGLKVPPSILRYNASVPE